MISEGIKFKIFLGGMPLDAPSGCTSHAYIIQQCLPHSSSCCRANQKLLPTGLCAVTMFIQFTL